MAVKEIVSAKILNKEQKRDTPVFLLLYSNNHGSPAVLNAVKAIDREQKGEMRFVTIDVTRRLTPALARGINRLKPEGYPQMISIGNGPHRKTRVGPNYLDIIHLIETVENLSRKGHALQQE